MIKYTRILACIMFFLCTNKIHAQIDDGIYLQPGYAYSSYDYKNRQTISLGICRVISTGPSRGSGEGVLGSLGSSPRSATVVSIAAIGLFKNKKLFPGMKFGMEGQWSIFAARMETGFTTQNFFLTPSVGLTFGGRLNLMAGYNIVMFEGGGSGFQLSLNMTFLQLK